jgi:F-type H+-transporting ATPase subunit b
MSSTLASLLLLAASEGGGGGGLLNVDRTLYFATWVLFGLFALVLGRFAWRPLLEIVANREKTVREQVEGAEKAQAEAQRLLAEQREKLRAMARDRDEMMDRARKEAEQVRAELVSKARGDAEQILTRAREQIERDASQAIQEVRTQIADLAVEAAERIVKSSLTREAQKKLVNDYIAGLPRSSS